MQIHKINTIQYFGMAKLVPEISNIKDKAVSLALKSNDVSVLNRIKSAEKVIDNACPSDFVTFSPDKSALQLNFRDWVYEPEYKSFMLRKVAKNLECSVEGFKVGTPMSVVDNLEALAEVLKKEANRRQASLSSLNTFLKI